MYSVMMFRLLAYSMKAMRMVSLSLVTSRRASSFKISCCWLLSTILTMCFLGMASRPRKALLISWALALQQLLADFLQLQLASTRNRSLSLFELGLFLVFGPYPSGGSKPFSAVVAFPIMNKHSDTAFLSLLFWCSLPFLN